MGASQFKDEQDIVNDYYVTNEGTSNVETNIDDNPSYTPSIPKTE